MKQYIKVIAIKPVFILLFLSFFGLTIFAQTGQGSNGESTTTTTTKKTSVSVNSTDNGNANAWYRSPWVWVVGAAIIILLMVALLSNRGSDTVTRDTIVQRTIKRDRNV